MNWLDINVLHFQYFILVFARIVTMIGLTPIFGSSSVPIQAKVGLAFIISIIVYPVVGREFPALPDQMILFWGLMLREVMVGILMGMVLNAMFVAMQLAGQIYGMQVGFGIVNVIDPLSELQISILGQFQFMIAMMLFLAVNGHHLVIAAIANSYRLVPMNSFHISEPAVWQVVSLLQKIFVVAIKVGFPMIAAVLLVTVAMGLVARTVPQINVFIVGIPINIAVGLFILGASIGMFAFVTKGYFTSMFSDLVVVFRMVGGT